MLLKRVAVSVLTATMIIISPVFATINADAKSSPKLSVSEYKTKYMTEKKNYKIKLSNAGKSKVTWKVKKAKGISSPVLKVVSKNKKGITVAPLRNGDGTIVCKVGKKRLECFYSVYLKQETEEADKNLTADELYQKALDNEIPVLRNQLYYDYETDSQQRYDDWYYLDDTENFTVKKADLDNDGADEVMIDNTDDFYYFYGGLYLDTFDGKVFELARGDGMSEILSHTTYNDSEWIVYSDTSHTDRQYWDFSRYNGYGDPVETFSIGWNTPEDSYESHDVYDEDCEFYYKKEEITEDEYIGYMKELGLTDYLKEEDQ